MTAAARQSLSELWTSFADTQCRGYSPLYDRICRSVASNDGVLALVEAAPPEAHMPNVLLAAAHYLLLGGLEHPLADVYAGTSTADPGPLFVDLCLTHRGAIEDLLRTRRTNTNEVGRSAVLGPALTAVGDRLGEPLGLVDVGCSAGLNLLCDRYRLDYGGFGATGPPDAAVQIDCRVVGGRPPIAARLPRITARVGLDRDPVDVRDDDAVRWQLACVWPDTGRLPRSRRAFDEARRSPPHIVRGDAVDSLAEVVASLPDDCVPVVMTTWAIAYLWPERRAAFVEGLSALVSERHPRLVWISGEGPGVVDAFSPIEPPTDDNGNVASILGCITFDRNGRESDLLAFVHPHGGWLDWRAASGLTSVAGE